jgi:HTH-type transcriptional regulator, glycine betaine synthesis regulator
MSPSNNSSKQKRHFKISACLISFFFETYEDLEKVRLKSDTIKAQNQNSVSVGSNKSLELEGIDFFVRLMNMMGMPRSVGEIYGLLYFSENPLPMDAVASKLGISIGSASQGLKNLRALKAVRSTYMAGDRRDHYVAESEFRRLFSNFIKDEIMPHLDSAKERILRMEELIDSDDIEVENEDFYKTRLDKLKRLTKASARLLPAMTGLLKL